MPTPISKETGRQYYIDAHRPITHVGSNFESTEARIAATISGLVTYYNTIDHRHLDAKTEALSILSQYENNKEISILIVDEVDKRCIRKESKELFDQMKVEIVNF